MRSLQQSIDNTNPKEISQIITLDLVICGKLSLGIKQIIAPRPLKVAKQGAVKPQGGSKAMQ